MSVKVLLIGSCLYLRITKVFHQCNLVVQVIELQVPPLDFKVLIDNGDGGSTGLSLSAGLSTLLLIVGQGE